MAKRRKKRSNAFFLVFKYFFLGIWYAFKYMGIGIYHTCRLICSGIGKIFNRENSVVLRAKKRYFPSKAKVSKIRILETVKGDYSVFWNKLKESDSLIGIVIGARGSGKTAIALRMAENLQDCKKKMFAMGFSELPSWIEIVDNIDEIKNDSLVIIDEGGILFSSRDSMSNSNKLLSELLFIARHKNLTILFISQNSSNLEINTLRQADFLILKRSSLLQKNFERKIIAKIYDEYNDKFEKYKDVKGHALVYSNDFVGFIENDLPSFWSTNVSKGFR